VTQTENQIIAVLQQLPELLKKEVLHFASFLSQKQIEEQQKKPKRKPGRLAGKMTISDDFDAPLDDFKPYME
jgi:hypothetical protein